MASGKKYKDLGPCAICGRAVLPWNLNVKLADEAQICSDCASKIRVMYPAVYGKRKGKRKKSLLDPIAELNLAQVREAMEKAADYIEDLRTRYRCNAAFEVEDISMEPHGWFKPPFIYAKGRCVFGYFDLGDEVWVLHRGSRVKAKLVGIKREDAEERGFENRESRGEGGFPYVCFTLSEKDLIVSPGDRIIKD